MKTKRRGIRILLIVIVCFAVLRLCMPSIVLHFVNKKLAALDGYYGHVDDIDIALYRGAYVVNDIYINKVDSVTKKQTHFFSCPEIDLSVEWSAIFKGKIVAEVEFEKPVVKYTLHKTIGEKTSDTVDFIQLVKDFVPVKINRFSVSGGEVHYVDQNEKPPVDIVLGNISIEATGFTNEPEKTKLLPASIIFKGDLYDGKLVVDVKLDPLSKIPVFDLNAELTQTNLVYLNPFF